MSQILIVCEFNNASKQFNKNYDETKIKSMLKLRRNQQSDIQTFKSKTNMFLKVKRLRTF